MINRVRTVLGEVEAEELGVVDAHSHLWICAQDVPAEDAPTLDNEKKILEELIAYRQSGGGAQVDCQPAGAGRDANQLRKLSAASGVPVVASTGFHLKRYYPAGYKIWKMNAEQAADFFLSEAADGLEESRLHQTVYPGLIKIAVEESLEQSPRQLLEAAVETSKKTGLLIEMHTEKGADIENIINFFENLNLSSDRLIICHIDKRPDSGLHSELAAAGYGLEYDTFFRPKYQPETNLWPLISELVGQGFGKALHLATDQADPGMWASMGSGPGLSGFITAVKKRLEELFEDQELVDDLTGGNISRRLSIIQGDI